MQKTGAENQMRRYKTEIGELIKRSENSKSHRRSEEESERKAMSSGDL